MRFAKSIIPSLLILSVPSTSCPQMKAPIYQVQTENADPHSHIEITGCLSYDDIMQFIDRIENEDLDEICDDADIYKVTMLIAQLAKEGIVDEQSEEAAEIAEDIEALLSENTGPYASYAYYLGGDTQYMITHAVYYGEVHTVLCKSWLKKMKEEIKEFCKKHKKAIIIGAAVVVAAVVVIATVGIAAGAGAAAAGAAAAAGSSPDNNQSKGAESSPAPSAQNVIQECIVDFKEAISIDPPPEVSSEGSHVQDNIYWNTMRDMGSKLAHETLDAVATIASFGPGLMQDAVNLTGKIAPSHELDMTPQKNFDDLVDAGHDAIDHVFSTDMAYHYSAEAASEREALRDALGISEPAIGILPIAPGLLSKTTIPVPITGKLSPTVASNVKGWSVGQPITNLTAEGNVPKWSTVRQRYWKNRAEMAKSNPQNKYNPEDIQRMEKGLAPQRLNANGQLESKELHHDPAQRDGGLFDFVELWADEHADIDPRRHLGK